MDLHIFKYFPTLKDFENDGQFANEQFNSENYPHMLCSDRLVQTCIKSFYIKESDFDENYREILFKYILSLLGLQLRMTRRNRPSLQKCIFLTPSQESLIDYFFVERQKNKQGFVVLPFSR